MKKRLISIDITCIPYYEYVEELTRLAYNRVASYVCVANVHMLAEAYWDSEFAEVVNGATMVTPDGMPLALGVKWVHGIKQDRVAGMDLLPDLLAKAEEKNIGVFFYGGTQKMLDHTSNYCKKEHPNLNLKGLISPPFRALTDEELDAYVDEINKSGAGFVFVVLGCPKQERWMASVHGRIDACLIGIGGALPVMVGDQKRAPEWMRKYALEWVFRFCQEPRRLFKRYFTTNSLFIYLLLKELLFGRKKMTV